MPAIRQEMLDCVFYLYGRNPKTGDIEGPWGSGVIVARYSHRADRDPQTERLSVLPNDRIHYYGVTNWHVSNKSGASIIRINTKDGGSRDLEFDPVEWHFDPNGDDLSAIDISDHLSSETDQISAYPEHLFITQEVIEDFKILAGEDTVMLGMLTNQHGGKRNKPAARFGNLSLLADDSAPIEQPNKVRRKAHLVDTRSRTGFSGSPVSIWRIPSTTWVQLASWTRPLLGDKGGMSINSNVTTRRGWFIGLLGIHCGQFPEPVAISKSPKQAIGDPIVEGDKLYIQSGMTIVIPAWRVSELLDSEVFEMARKKRDAERTENQTERVVPEVQPEAALPENDENPNRRVDFMRLASAAARTRKQGE